MHTDFHFNINYLCLSDEEKGTIHCVYTFSTKSLIQGTRTFGHVENIEDMATRKINELMRRNNEQQDK
jgi:hypothetical protein